jgi:hypothetical protein
MKRIITTGIIAAMLTGSVTGCVSTQALNQERDNAWAAFEWCKKANPSTWGATCADKLTAYNNATDAVAAGNTQNATVGAVAGAIAVGLLAGAVAVADSRQPVVVEHDVYVCRGWWC